MKKKREERRRDLDIRSGQDWTAGHQALKAPKLEHSRSILINYVSMTTMYEEGKRNVADMNRYAAR